jgi:hypothetical protein
MGRPSKLISEARNLAAARGHKLGEFLLSRIETGSPPVSTRDALTAVCAECGALVGVDPAAPAGVYKIWGEALEIDCQDRQAGRIPAELREGLQPGQTVVVTSIWGGPSSIATVVKEAAPGVYELKDAAGNHFYAGAAHIRPQNEG